MVQVAEEGERAGRCSRPGFVVGRQGEERVEELEVKRSDSSSWKGELGVPCFRWKEGRKEEKEEELTLKTTSQEVGRRVSQHQQQPAASGSGWNHLE